MKSDSSAKWDKAAANLQEDLRPLLLLMKSDYEAAAKIHTPTYTGGPNAGILSELIRSGWRKLSL